MKSRRDTDALLRERLTQMGFRIAFLRKRRHMSQEQLAEAIEVSLSYLAKLEANTGANRASPSLEILFRIADALSVLPEELIKDLPRNPNAMEVDQT